MSGFQKEKADKGTGVTSSSRSATSAALRRSPAAVWRVAGAERAARRVGNQQFGQGADRHAGVGTVGGVHGEQFGDAGERLAVRGLAPGDNGAPNQAVDPAGVVTSVGIPPATPP